MVTSKNDAVVPNRREKRYWNQYVADAKATFSEIVISDDLTLTVYIPTADAIVAMNDAEGDLWKQLTAVLGEENAAQLREVAQDAPVTALSALLMSVLEDLGLNSGAPGDSSAA